MKGNNVNLKLLALFSIFLTNILAAHEIQYFIPKKFYESLFTISVGYGQNHFYSPGKLLEEAINMQTKKDKILKKCLPGEKSKKIIQLTPDSSYNPQMNVFQTDLKVDFLDETTEVVVSKKITHKTVTRMTSHEDVILNHYKKLVEKLIDVDELRTSESESLIDGKICY